MYRDEKRDENQLRRLRALAAAANPKSSFARLRRSVGAEFDTELGNIVRERQTLLDELQVLKKDLQRAKTDASKAKRAASRAEYQLKQVRASKTMKLGRALTSPVRATRLMQRDPEAAAKEVQERLLHTARQAKRRLSQVRPLNAKSISKACVGEHSIANARVEDRHRSALNAAVVAKHDIENFEALLKYSWYERGAVEASFELVAQNRELLEKCSPRVQTLARLVEGAYRVRDFTTLPPRSGGPAYQVEPGRIMYCVHQTPVFNSNGYSTRTRGVVSGMHEAGCDVVVVGRLGFPWDSSVDIKKPKPERFVKSLDDVDYVHLAGANLNRDSFHVYVQQAADAIVREAKVQRPALIQAASNYRNALPALVAARRLGIPFVYEVRGLWELSEAASKPGFEHTERFALMVELETLVASEADAVFTITSQVRDELVNRGVDADCISLAPNAVDPLKFVPLPRDERFAEKLGISSEVPVVGFAGSLVEYEGLDDLLRASQELQEKGVEHQIAFAGSGKAEAGLKSLAKELELENVAFLGRLPQEDMARLQSTFDVVACPRKSLRVTELVSPLKPLEAFASGKAVLLSDVAPNKDLAGVFEERALLFEAGNSRDLARVLRTMLEDPELRRQLGRRGRMWVVKERTWRQIAAAMMDVHTRAHEYFHTGLGELRRLQALHVGVIGDEFTRTTLHDAFETELLYRNRWRDQLSATKFDLIFVESAWKGNDGDWTRGIGHYSDHESRDLRDLLAFANELDIPTVFWNKEDPVHFARFAPNAALFDHILTTDADMIPKYLEVASSRVKSVSALPFYAQPKIHNPLPGNMEFRNTAAYAGTYYGERYAERSRGLDMLLEEASCFGLDIYDRQASNPDSPYKFPARYAKIARGSLPYEQVIDSYKAHTVQLNVNSVMDSPTMFSRRVVEIPASGGIVLSSYSRGIAESLGSNIAFAHDAQDARAFLNLWFGDATGRLSEIWRQMRTVYRSHTTETALSIVARTVGIATEELKTPKYECLVTGPSEGDPHSFDDIINAISQQSLLPVSVMADGTLTDSQRKALEARGVAIRNATGEGDTSSSLIQLVVDHPIARTFAEDILLPFRFGRFGAVYQEPASSFDAWNSVMRETFENTNGHQVATLAKAEGAVSVILPDYAEELPSSDLIRRPEETLLNNSKPTILFAGHDLKFARGYIDYLTTQGYKVLIDLWENHTKHDEAESFRLLTQADVIFCEWGLGNAVWYSQNKEERQRLVVRVHLQELFRPFLSQIVDENVDWFIFVGELIRQAAITSHGIPAEKSVVISNYVDAAGLKSEKSAGAKYNIGLVGIVPQRKRLDLAIDLMEKLLPADSRYKLYIKGKTYEDYPWMLNRPDEISYFREQEARIDRLNKQYPGAVVFDGFDRDMAAWYKKIGVVISVSDFESFHFTLPDGAASGALPVSLNWAGSDLIYPQSWLVASVEDMAKRILESSWETERNAATELVQASFDEALILPRLLEYTLGAGVKTK